jgi:hypothetical protein
MEHLLDQKEPDNDLLNFDELHDLLEKAYKLLLDEEV